jgi:hypothetical protein
MPRQVPGSIGRSELHASSSPRQHWTLSELHAASSLRQHWTLSELHAASRPFTSFMLFWRASQAASSVPGCMETAGRPAMRASRCEGSNATSPPCLAVWRQQDKQQCVPTGPDTARQPANSSIRQPVCLTDAKLRALRSRHSKATSHSWHELSCVPNDPDTASQPAVNGMS